MEKENLQQTLDQKIKQYCRENAIMGMIRVTRKDEILYEQSIGFADVANSIPFEKDAMFSFYSLSKPFCAIGLLKLKDKGLVDLDAHPSRYVPEAAGLHKDVTIRQILTHTSGLPDFEQVTEFKEKYAPGYAKSARAHLRLLADYPSYFEPGTQAKYANINFVLCALIIENVSKMDYASYMKAEVLRPLGMGTAVVDNEALYIPKRVKGYQLENGGLSEVEKSHDWMFGAGDIVGTVDDVYCLNTAIKKGLLLSHNTWEEVLTPSPVSGMGMGCTVSQWYGKRRITHNGGHTGFRTLHIQIQEDDFDVIILSNSGFGDARNALSEMIFSAFYGNMEQAARVEMDKGYIN